MAQRFRRQLPAWRSVKLSTLRYWPKFARRWGPKHYLDSVETMRLSSTRLLALTQDRCVFNQFIINSSSRIVVGCWQIEAARTIWDLLHGSDLAVSDEKEVTIDEDEGELRQDRYPLRTAPQFLGPQIEDILAALNSVSIECNSSTSGLNACSTLPTDEPY